MNTTAVKERPILFKPEMVRAIRNNTKTQTRRIAKGRDGELPPAEFVRINQVGPWFHFENTRQSAAERDQFGPVLKMWTIRCPYGQPGDRLWVRETWGTDARLNGLPPSALFTVEGGNPVYYRADGKQPELLDTWRPSIHMPRAASRVLLEITAVRVERLQDISESDAENEGVEVLPGRHKGNPTYRDYHDADFFCYLAKESYATLWDSINGEGTWAANPWVWVVEFKVIPQ